jgi:hypothetical protein
MRFSNHQHILFPYIRRAKQRIADFQGNARDALAGLARDVGSGCRGDILAYLDGGDRAVGLHFTLHFAAELAHQFFDHLAAVFLKLRQVVGDCQIRAQARVRESGSHALFIVENLRRLQKMEY